MAPTPDDELTWNWVPAPLAEAPRKRVAGSILGAAMLGLGEIIEPEKTKVEIQQEDDRPLDDAPFELEFGELPPLN